jgi:hypothetical protein
MQEVAALLKAIAWPAVVLIVFFLMRSQLLSLLSVLATKMDRSSRVKIGGKLGIELAEEVVRGHISLGHGSATATLQDFERHAEEYDKLRISDEAERVAERRRLADRLGSLALQLRLGREGLAQSHSEGQLVALATSIVLKPMGRDLASLEKAAKTANFNFTRYRMVLALTPTLARPNVNAQILRRVGAVLDDVETRPNVETAPALQRLIERTRAAIPELLASSE